MKPAFFWSAFVVAASLPGAAWSDGAATATLGVTANIVSYCIVGSPTFDLGTIRPGAKMTASADVQLSCQLAAPPHIWFSGGNLVSQNGGAITNATNGLAYTLSGGGSAGGGNGSGSRAAPYDPGSAVSLVLDSAGQASYRVTATIAAPGIREAPPAGGQLNSLTVNLSY